MADAFDAITIGSGLGGLTAAALHARTGKRVLVLERNHGFGGAASTYRHGPLTIEASLHETTDPRNPEDPKALIFQALGVLDDLEFVPVGDFYQVRGPLFDPPIALPHGRAAAERALAEHFPEHRRGVAKFFQRIDAVQSALALVGEEHDTLWWILHAPSVPFRLWPLLRDLRLSLSEMLQDLFGDDERPKIALAANLPYYADDPAKLWWLFYAIAQGGYLTGGGYYIRGGSGRLSETLIRVVEAEGGAALSGRTVTRILCDAAGRATGVVHCDGEGGDPQEARAPVLFGNAAPGVLAEALPEPQRADFLAPYAGRRPSTSLFSAAIGLSRPPAELGFTHYSTMLIPGWMSALHDYVACAGLLADAPGERTPALTLVDYSAIDSGLNPGGPHLVTIVGLDRFENWPETSGPAYAAKRDAWLTALIATVDQTFPGFAAAVVQSELATAVTMQRYLNTPGGALYGFAPEPPKGLPTAGTEKGVATAIPGLWLASSYGGFGGFTGAMMSGALAAQAARRAQSG